QADVHGEPGQLVEAHVRLVEEDGREHLELTARIEDVETGGLLSFRAHEPVRVPPGVPARGGPRPKPADEDELDWEDETTLEQLVVNAPEAPARPERDDDEPIPARGLSPLEA